MTLILKAAQFAARAHEGQLRKFTKTPYIYHPARVAARVAIRSDATDEMVAAAFLHDVVEDTTVTLPEINAVFGNVVLGLVDELTNPSKKLDLPREGKKKVDREHLAGVSREAKIIKMLDRIDNLKEMDRSDLDFLRIYAKESWLLSHVVSDADAALANELRGVILSLVPQLDVAE